MENIINKINNLDIKIINKLGERTFYNTNTHLYKPYEHGGIFVNNNWYDSYLNYKLNETNIKIYSNFNSFIKMSYLNLLYDITEYGENNDYLIDNIINLDIEILSLLNERINIGITIFKYQYILYKNYFNNLVNDKNNENKIKQYLNLDNYIEYINNIIEISKKKGINEFIIYQYYKIYIIPLTIDAGYSYYQSILKS